MQVLAALHAGSTCFLAGLVWFVQLVHYPLLASLPVNGYGDYHRGHSRLTTRLVVPVMAVEGASAVLLLALQPSRIPTSWLALGMALLLLIWEPQPVHCCRLTQPFAVRLSHRSTAACSAGTGRGQLPGPLAACSRWG